jgi:hypothetical protein
MLNRKGKPGAYLIAEINLSQSLQPILGDKGRVEVNTFCLNHDDDDRDEVEQDDHDNDGGDDPCLE